MKKLKSVLVIALAVMMAFVSCTKDEESSDSAGTRPAASNKNINIATASVGGAYYAVGQEIANLVNKYADGLTMAPEVTAGAVENPRLVDQGDADFGITNANFAYAGVRGEDPYQKVLNISALANMHPSVFHIITLESSNIHSIADLKGAKIAVGPAGGGTMPILENVLSLYGLSVDDITPSYLSYDDGFTQLSDGNVDVALALSGYPASSVMQISTQKAIRFIEVTEEDMAKLSEMYPYYNTIMVPGEVYNLDADARAVGIANVLFCNNDIDEETVYQVCKAVFDNLNEFAENNATAEQIDPDALADTAIDLHPGAARYYAERNQ